MSDSISNKPDLDDTSNVNIDAAAAARENHMFTEGAEPLSLWVILGGAMIVLIGGGVLFGGNVFDYKNFVKKGYARQPEPGDGDKKVKPQPALKAYMKVGKKVYGSCAGCHQGDGQGNASTPPLANSEWVTGPSMRPAMIVLNGIHGPITVAGKPWNSSMSAMGEGMPPEQLAGLLNYIRNSFGNKADKLITVEMAENAIAASKKRNGGQVTAAELNAKFKYDIKGTEVPLDTLVDPKTLKPAAPAAE